MSLKLIARAKEEGCGALVLTVDLAVPGSRYRDARAGAGGFGGIGEVLAAPVAMGRRAPRPADSFGNLEPIVGSARR